MLTHQYAYIDSTASVGSSLFVGKGGGAKGDAQFHEAYRLVLGAVAWIVLTRAELAVYLQVFQRRAHPPRINDCTRSDIVIRYMERHNCGLRSVTLNTN